MFFTSRCPHLKTTRPHPLGSRLLARFPYIRKRRDDQTPCEVLQVPVAQFAEHGQPKCGDVPQLRHSSLSSYEYGGSYKKSTSSQLRSSVPNAITIGRSRYEGGACQSSTKRLRP